MPRLSSRSEPNDHVQAAAICDDCPIRLRCASHTAACLADPSYGLGVHGTWNGALYKGGRQITRKRGLREARSAYVRGDRSEWATAGNSAYERDRYERKKAQS